MTSVRGIMRTLPSAAGDDRGSLPLALLVTLIGSALAALLVPMVLMQGRAVAHVNERGAAVVAAQSGLDLTVGLIRAATAIDPHAPADKADKRAFADAKTPLGDPTKLPCGPVNGTLDGQPAGTYQVTISYYVLDPRTMTTSARTSEQMNCESGYGVSYRDSLGKNHLMPGFALLTATGVSSADGGSRTLEATYVFRTTNAHIRGGLMPLFTPSITDSKFCLDGGDKPKAGDTVTIQPCPAEDDPIPDQMKWSYLSNLTLQLAKTVGDLSINGSGTGLCIQSNGSGKDVTLAKCPANSEENGELIPGPATWNLIWGIDDSAQFSGSNSTKTNIDSNSCLYAASLEAGKKLSVAKCSGSVSDMQRVFNPTPNVGAGAATRPITGPPDATNIVTELVNFESFSRCIDVTNQRVQSGDGGSFLILYPCKQNPNKAQITWNQKFTIVPNAGGVELQVYPEANVSESEKGWYCVVSPRTEGGYVFVKKCSNANTTEKTWTRYESDGVLPAQKFTFVDKSGRCLATSPSDDLFNGNYSKTVVETCNGRGSQKWNADPNVESPALKNLREDN